LCEPDLEHEGPLGLGTHPLAREGPASSRSAFRGLGMSSQRIILICRLAQSSSIISALLTCS
jgi:hypothetical protein